MLKALYNKINKINICLVMLEATIIAAVNWHVCIHVKGGEYAWQLEPVVFIPENGVSTW